MLYFSAILVGVFGSLHCIGMCGPIMLSLPGAKYDQWSLLYTRFLYNLGRVLGYGLLGLIVGLLGQGFLLAGTQQFLSILIGGGILFFLILPPRYVQMIEPYTPIPRLIRAVKKGFANVLNRKGKASYLYMGVLNGFLPCGLVYMALAGALATGELWGGVFYMFLFGIGTFPLMLSMGLIPRILSPRLRQRVHTRVLPIFTFLLALMFILRGLNLGIPYVSPKIHQSHAEGIKMECCVESEVEG